jgi:hypothetical protein
MRTFGSGLPRSGDKGVAKVGHADIRLDAGLCLTKAWASGMCSIAVRWPNASITNRTADPPPLVAHLHPSADGMRAIASTVCDGVPAS